MKQQDRHPAHTHTHTPSPSLSLTLHRVSRLFDVDLSSHVRTDPPPFIQTCHVKQRSQTHAAHQHTLTPTIALSISRVRSCDSRDSAFRTTQTLAATLRATHACVLSPASLSPFVPTIMTTTRMTRVRVREAAREKLTCVFIRFPPSLQSLRPAPLFRSVSLSLLSCNHVSS